MAQAEEGGVAHLIFQNTLPQKYLYRYILKLQIPASKYTAKTMLQVAKAFWYKVLKTDRAVALVP